LKIKDCNYFHNQQTKTLNTKKGCNLPSNPTNHESKMKKLGRFIRSGNSAIAINPHYHALISNK
jgi:hypothetical protein